MPQRTDIKKILIIGSGPTAIGQAAEYDYIINQACLALKEEGYEVVLVNSNAGDVTSDKEIVDHVYIEPVTVEFVARILRKERPDAILPTFGGQTALRVAQELEASGILTELAIESLSLPNSSIKHQDFLEKELTNLQQLFPLTKFVRTVKEGLNFVQEMDYPVFIRARLTIAGVGSGVCYNKNDLKKSLQRGLKASPIAQCEIKQSLAGFKEIEFEVIRDARDNALVVSHMENFDPVGIHSGDSIVFAPSQTLTDHEYQLLRDTSLQIIRTLKIEGSCHIRLALDTKSLNYYVLAIHPRLTRSSVLASKASGYPMARIAAKVATGFSLSEIKNPITPALTANFEPTLDYIVTKLPTWSFINSKNAQYPLNTQMKTTGGVMAIDRTLEASLLKAVHSLDTSSNHIELSHLQRLTDEKLIQKIIYPQSDRLFSLAESLRRGYKIEELAEMTKIHPFFIDKIAQIVEMEETLEENQENIEVLQQAKQKGFSDTKIAQLWEYKEETIRFLREQHQLSPVFKMVDTCAGEFNAQRPYFYSTYETENEATPTKSPTILILGAGPARIGEGTEFDYTTVHAVKAIQQAGYKALLVNDNPASSTTDFMLADKLYFTSLTFEEVYKIIELEKPLGIIIQFGGKKAQSLGEDLAYFGIKILGISQETISQVNNPVKLAANLKEGTDFQPDELSFPSREETDPSFILGKKCEVQAIYDGDTVFIPGLLEYIEQTDVHTGDSIAVYPSQDFSQEIITTLKSYTKRLFQALNIRGAINIQFVVSDKQIYVRKISPYINRATPFLSKVTGIPVVEIALRTILGDKLSGLIDDNLALPLSNHVVYVQVPAFSLTSLSTSDGYTSQAMKSTGAVMSTDINLEKALYKAFKATDFNLPEFGTILFAVNDQDKTIALDLAQRFSDIGFTIIATQKTAAFFNEHGLNVRQIDVFSDTRPEEIVLEEMNSSDIPMIVYMSHKIYPKSDYYAIQRKAIEQGAALFTSLDTLAAVLKVIQFRTFSTKEL
ncbi:carbamoyl phosphate synthase large subunit [Tetragenococcus osmophilus]|uniref:carbamoyl-phosphate synthase (ammonia) n=1 Tax=Tetragenococcus osmophilus TaxID=526944 RepID=A0ABM7AAZ2_9ENTE|nr:carbamoyl phosphate synthase large subunit [Tetragenococcus osmophilus]AYW48578.1 carbamoyl phosphate synthase large subunit [Tetragenococcus osmophilus]GMA54488.1 carbamoyl-phosphate synthase (glutamine-hydrolyzing) [Alicyclobacillus contaminans]